MAKYFIQNLVITGALCAFATTASFAQPAQTLASAQKAYVNGNWKEAAAAYEVVCPTQPDSTRTECFLWNVLALSQTGVTADFSKAGKRLDSLIEKTSPQKAIYADLMMTKAQFQMYLGRYNKAAESLVHAIETSQPHQVTVLQKVCSAVQDRAHSEELNAACKDLGNPEALKARAEQAAKKEQIANAEQKPQAAEQLKEQPKTAEIKTPATSTVNAIDAKPAEERARTTRYGTTCSSRTTCSTTAVTIPKVQAVTVGLLVSTSPALTSTRTSRWWRIPSTTVPSPHSSARKTRTMPVTTARG